MLAIAATLTTSFVACDDDEETAGPSIVAPTSPTVKIESTNALIFDVTVPGGYKSATVEVTGGSAEILSEPAASASTGEIVIEYVAEGAEGSETLTLVVTDNANKTQTSTVNITVSAFETVVVAGQLEGTHNWTSDKIYELQGRVILKEEGVLNIEAGTVIKGQEGTGVNASALMIARGATINAQGTAAAPIIFTSVLDNILPGQKSGTTLTTSDRGKWGGLVILGKAPISVSGATEAQIEGVPASETLGLYGGETATDNSGTLQHISIRHGGSIIAEGSEINGLTLGGVGSGTTVSDIEIFANEDDGVEFFGGAVNVTNILVAYQGDDAIDIDQAYSGTIDGFYVIHGGSTDEGLEIDGPEGSENATGRFTLTNGTLVGDPSQAGDASSLGDFKSRAQGTVENVLFKGYTAGKKIKIAASYATACAPGSANAFSNLVDDMLVFSDVDFTGYVVDVYSASVDNCAEANVPSADQDAAEGKVVSSAVTSGIPAGSTWDWTLTKEKSLIQ